MKKLRILISLLLTMSLVLCLGASAFAQTDLKVSLGEMLGEMEGEDIEFWTGTLTTDFGGKFFVLDAFGEKKLDRGFDYVHTLFCDNELLTGYDDSKSPNSYSLVKADGTVLFEDAAIVMESDSNGRYLEVTFGTEVVENEEDAIFSYSNWDENDESVETMYAGYTQIFDMQEERFVEGLRIENSGDYFSFVGENILLTTSDWDEPDQLFRPDGSLIASTNAYKTGDRYFVQEAEDGGYLVLDENLNELCALSFEPYGIYADTTVFATDTEDFDFRLVNAAGEAVSDLIFEYPPDESDSFLYGEDENGFYAVLRTNGELVLSFEEQISYVRRCDYGFLSLSYEDGSFGLLYPDGSLAALKEECDARLFSLPYDSNEIFLLGPAAYIEYESYCEPYGDLVFGMENEEGLYGLYSLVDGQELLPPVYDRINYANGLIYAQRVDDGIYEIYPVIVNG